jgi:hypothetical protein
MRRISVVLSALALGVVLALVGGAGVPVQPAHGLDGSQLSDIQDRIIDGLGADELGLFEARSPDNNANNTQQPSQYFPRGSNSCPTNLSSNIKVNQNCLNVSDPDLQGRGQAQNETSIAQNPTNTNNFIAAYNDYRRGDGNCGVSYSLDKARTWNDATTPSGFTRGRVQNVADFGAAREYWGGGGDASVAYDSKGNAYLSCQLFNRGRPTTSNADTSSALVVFRSTQNDGASFNFPGRYVRASNDTTGSGISPFLDKQLMTVDNNATSCQSTGSSYTTGGHPGQMCTPFQDRIYVSWTEFAADGSGFIYEAYSADYGEHFSAPHLVSADSPLCTNDYGVGTIATGGESSHCNENQFSQPFVGPDGSLYITYNNYNNSLKDPQDNRNQILLSKSVDGGNTFTPPVKVSDYYDLPDCATYQKGRDFGRACIPEKNATNDSVFRATNYSTGAVNPTNPAQVVVTLGSYINPHSNEANGCVPTGFSPATGQDLYTGVKTPGACNNDILESVSNDGGLTFTGTTTDPRAETTVNQDPAQAVSDQFWQWIDFTKNGKLATSYYDRQYDQNGSSSNSTLPFDEATGYSDVSLSGSGDLVRFNTYRVTSSPMPPPTEFAGLFFGDYTGLAGIDNAYPIWMDTRNPDVFICPGTATTTTAPALCGGKVALTPGNPLPANDQDVYVASLPVPSK